MLLVGGAARADSVSVQCGANPATLPPGTYATLNAALAAVSLSGPHTITVNGVCHENVHAGPGLQSRDRLTIQGPEGGTATITNAANPPFWVLAIGRSRQITLRRLVVTGGSIGIRIDSASSVDIADCTVESNDDGILVDENSTVRLGRVTVRNNEGDGLVITRSSEVALSLGGPDPPFVTISGNGGSGIVINTGTLTSARALSIENNGGAVISATAGQVQISGGPGAAPNVMRNNGFGLNAINNSFLSFNGINVIENNGSTGIQIARASTLQIGGATTISGHNTGGINAVQGAVVSIAGAARIQGNGVGSTLPESAAGIRIGSSSLNISGGVEVLNNQGPGIMADLGSTVSVGSIVPSGVPLRITGNSADGVQLNALSAARFNQAPAITNNGGSSVSCDRSSWLFGDTTDIQHIKCASKD